MLESIMNRLYSREDGQALVEYALILTLVAIVAIGGLTALGVNINTELQTIADTLP
jgi:Flp pilus assembly pilin Flp